MEYLFNAVLIIVAILIFLATLGVGLFIIVWLARLLFAEQFYHNRLRLTYLSRLEDFQIVTRQGAMFGWEKELLRIAQVLQVMKLERSMLADGIKTIAEREDCRRDLEHVKNEARDLMAAEKQPMAAGNIANVWMLFGFIGGRPWPHERMSLLESLFENIPIQLAHLEGWRPRERQETKLNFSAFAGEYVIRREAGRVTAAAVWLHEKGQFEFYHKDRGGRTLLRTYPEAHGTRVELSPPAESGQLEIVRKEDGVIELIALI